MKIQNGIYDASIVDARYVRADVPAQAYTRTADGGSPSDSLRTGTDDYVAFMFRIGDTNLSVNWRFYPLCKDGTPNTKAMTDLRRWAAEWDGTDLRWFEENLDFCRHYRLRMRIENRTTPRGNTYPAVLWIYPNSWNRSAITAAETGVTPGARTAFRTDFDPAAISTLPEDLQLTMNEVYGAFRLATASWTPSERDATWFALVAEAASGKDQILFAEEEWGKILAKLKGQN